MHPIERLRYVARAEGAGPTALAREAAGALLGFADEPQGLVTACRRLVDRHPECGPVWWLASCVLLATDPLAAAYSVVDRLDSDPTPAALAEDLPEDATAVVIGWPELAGAALRRRGDLEVLVVDSLGEGAGFAARLGSAGVDTVGVPESGLGPAVSESGLVLLEASALAREGLLAPPGSLAAAAVASATGVPVWAVAGEGRVLPGRVWGSVVARLASRPGEPWERGVEVVPLGLVGRLAGPAGLEEPRAAVEAVGWAAPPELLKPVSG